MCITFLIVFSCAHRLPTISICPTPHCPICPTNLEALEAHFPHLCPSCVDPSNPNPTENPVPPFSPESLVRLRDQAIAQNPLTRTDRIRSLIEFLCKIPGAIPEGWTTERLKEMVWVLGTGKRARDEALRGHRFLLEEELARLGMTFHQ